MYFNWKKLNNNLKSASVRFIANPRLGTLCLDVHVVYSLSTVDALAFTHVKD